MNRPNPSRRACSFALAFLTALPLHLAAQQGAQGATATPEEDVVVLSPFQVDASRDEGYTATQSLAGGRLATPLRDTGAAITVLTREFLDDVAASNFLEAADWAPNSNSVYSAQGPQVFNDYQVNFRSLGGGFQSRNYFRWYINSDIYNTDRIDFARGPNSVVFGDAGVGGIANVSSKRAFKGSRNEVSLRWNSFDGARASFDFNRALSDKLYVRVAGVWDHSDDWVDAQRIDREGAFISATYAFSPKTQIRGELEWGHVERVVGFFPFDVFSNWDGTTVVTAPRTSGNFGGGVSRFTADTLVWVPGTPSLGITNWRNWGQTGGTVRQMLTTPMELAPVNNPTIPRLSLSFQSPEATADNPYGVGALFFEHQMGDNLFFELAGNYQEQYRDVIQHFAQGVTVDVNQFLPNGAANPDFLKRYTQDRRRETDQSNKVHEWRGSLAYLLDTSLTEQRLLVSAGQRFDRFDNDAYELVRTNGTDLRLDQAANRIQTRRYEDNLGAGLDLPKPTGDPSGIATKYARLGGGYNDNELQFAQIAASGGWFEGRRLKTIFAARRDELHVERAGAVLDPVTREWVGYTGETSDPDYSVTTYTAGGVFTVTKSINAFVNYAESFQPATAAVSIDGSPIPPLFSTGVDAGLRLSLLDGKITGSVSYYWNEQENTRTSGSSAEINTIWTDLNSSEQVQTGYNDTFSLKGQGLEVDFTANLSKSWRVMLNFSLPETEQAGGYAATRAYYDANLATWQAGAAALTDPAIQTRINNNIATIKNRIESFAEGRELNGAYKYTANLFTNYTIGNGSWKGFSVGGGVQMRGDRLVTNRPGNSFDYLWSDSYYLVTGTLGYRMKVFEKPLRLQLNVSNLLDDELIQPTRYNNYTVSGVTSFVPDRYYIQPPRRYTLTATYEF